MKKLILTALVASVAGGSALAQGYITFSASGGFRPVEYTTDGVTVTKVEGPNSPAVIGTYGDLNVAVYATSSGSALTSSTTIGTLAVPNFDINGWTIGGTIIQNTSALGGIANTTIVFNNLTGGVNNEIEVVGWTGNYTSFDAALTAAEAGQALIGWSGGGGTLLTGGAFGWLNSTGTSSTPAVNSTGTAAFDGLLLQPVPEPTTLVLGGLGAAALLLFRRRK